MTPKNTFKHAGLQCQFYVMSLLLFIMSCKENRNEILKTSEDTTISSALENKEEEVFTNSYQDSESQEALYKALKKKTPLTDEQLLAALPEHINGSTVLNEYARQAHLQEASGMYGSTQSPYTFWIMDGAGSKVVVRNFYDSFKLKNQGPEGTEYVFSEHDGYKTITFLQPKIKQNQISFIYNDRFKIALLGPDNADALWSYIDFENLKKLDAYK